MALTESYTGRGTAQGAGGAAQAASEAEAQRGAGSKHQESHRSQRGCKASFPPVGLNFLSEIRGKFICYE